MIKPRTTATAATAIRTTGGFTCLRVLELVRPVLEARGFDWRDFMLRPVREGLRFGTGSSEVAGTLEGLDRVGLMSLSRAKRRA
jgi:hypothetical protein